MSKMVSRIFEQKEPIRLVLCSDRSTGHLVPTWQDLDVVHAIDSAISPLSGLTDILSGGGVCNSVSCPSNVGFTGN